MPTQLLEESQHETESDIHSLTIVRSNQVSPISQVVGLQVMQNLAFPKKSLCSKIQCVLEMSLLSVTVQATWRIMPPVMTVSLETILQEFGVLKV